MAPDPQKTFENFFFFFGLLRRFCTFNTDKDFQKLMEVLHCLK